MDRDYRERRVGAIKAHTALRQPIKVRRLHLRITIAAEAVAQVIRHDEEHIQWPRRRRVRNDCQPHAREAKQRAADSSMQSGHAEFAFSGSSLFAMMESQNADRLQSPSLWLTLNATSFDS